MKDMNTPSENKNHRRNAAVDQTERRTGHAPARLLHIAVQAGRQLNAEGQTLRVELRDIEQRRQRRRHDDKHRPSPLLPVDDHLRLG